MMDPKRWVKLSRWALFLSLATMPFTNLHILTYPLPHVTLLACSLLFFFALLTDSLAKQRTDHIALIRLSPMWPFVFFVLSAFLSVMAASNETYPPAVQFKGFIYLIKPIILCFFAVLVIIPGLIRTKQHFHRACLWVSVGYIGSLVLGILGFFQQHHVSAGRLEHSIDHQFLRFQSIPFEWGAFTPLYPNRNILGEILLPGCVFIMFLYHTSGRRRYLVLMGAAFFVLLGTQSRSTYLVVFLLVIVTLMHRYRMTLPSGLSSWFQRLVLVKPYQKRPVVIAMLLALLFMASSLMISRLDALWWDGQQTSRFFSDGKTSDYYARRRGVEDELEKEKFLTHYQYMKYKDELLKTSRSRAKPVRLDWMAYGNRLLQLRISLRNLVDGASIPGMFLGKGLRTYQFHLNSTPEFTNRFGHCWDFREQIDAHGWLTKVAIEQGWMGIFAMTSILGLFIMLVLKGFSMIVIDNDFLPYFSLVPLSLLVFFISTTNYYQPVLWLPFGLAWRALTGDLSEKDI